MVRAVSERHGPLGLARNTVGQALNSTGFVHGTGPLDANFRTYLSRSPVDLAMEDLKPGLLADLADWVASELENKPEQAMQIQAWVEGREAIPLLT
jgi:hypothetical protein